MKIFLFLLKISTSAKQFKYFFSQSHLTLYLIETPFNMFVNRADPDQALSGSTLLAYGNMIRYYHTLVDLTNTVDSNIDENRCKQKVLWVQYIP